MKKALLSLLALCLISITSSHAEISFGGRESAIEVSGGSLTLGSGKTLADGVLRDTGGAITATSATCTNMVIETVDGTTTKSMQADGSLTLGSALALSNNQFLTVDGGQVAETVSVTAAAATPAIIQGHGSLSAAISVSGDAAAAGLIMRWNGGLNQNISMDTDTNAVTVTLENDLHFINGAKVHATSNTAVGTVDFGGYKMFLGGGSTGTLTIGALNQTWNDAKLVLEGDVTVSATLTFSQSASDTISIDGNGHTLTVSGALADGGINGTITNATLDSYGTGVFAGSTGNWTLRDVILNESTESLRVIDGVIAGATDDVFSGSSTWPTASRIELLKDFQLEGTMLLDDDTNGSFINGNGHTFTFDDSSAVLAFDADLTLTDIVLRDVITNSLNNDAGANLLLRNVTWHDGGLDGVVRINPTSKVADVTYATLTTAGTTTDGLLLGDDVTWTNGVSLELLSDVTLASTWTFSGKSEINGHGHVLHLGSGVLDYDADLWLSNVILGDVADASFNRAASQFVYMSDVTWIDNTTEGAMRINAATTGASGVVAAAKVEFPDGAAGAAGNIFGVAVDWVNGANIDLLGDVTISASWTFSEDSVINGHGHVITLGAPAALNIGNGKTLTITNAVVKDWDDTNDIDFVSATGTLALSDVTIILADTPTALAAGEKITVNGPVTFVTGGYIFDASNADTNNTINGVTVWYDTLGGSDSSNVNFGSPGGSPTGQIAMLPVDDSTGVTTYTTAAKHVNQSMFLSYRIDVSNDDIVEALGRQVVLDNTSTFNLQGNGRTWYMAPRTLSSDTAMDVDVDDENRLVMIDTANSATNVVEIHDLTFDGWAEEHIKDDNALMRYCTGTIIRLQSDQSLTTQLNFATATTTGDVVIDLNGQDLDMSHDSAEFNLPNVATTLTIKNGRLINFNNHDNNTTKIVTAGTSPTIVFQDVDLLLADNANDDGEVIFGDHNVTFKGDCKISGTMNLTCHFKYTDVTIDAGASLTVEKGMTLKFSGTTANDPTLTFTSNNSTLNLLGCTLDTQSIDASSMAFYHGTVRVDDKVTFEIGSGKTLTLGGTTWKDIDLDIMPAARMVVNSGIVSYENGS